MAPKGSPPEAARRPGQRGPDVGQRMSKLEARKGEIIGMIVIGTPPHEMLRELGITSNAFYRFKQKHQTEIEAAFERRSRRLEDYAIASQVDRIVELQWWYDKTKAEVEEHGITVEEVVTAGDKESTISTREYRATLVKEARGLLRDAAEELGQLKDKPKNGGDTNNIAILIRQVEGYTGLIE